MILALSPSQREVTGLNFSLKRESTVRFCIENYSIQIVYYHLIVTVLLVSIYLSGLWTKLCHRYVCVQQNLVYLGFRAIPSLGYLPESLEWMLCGSVRESAIGFLTHLYYKVPTFSQRHCFSILKT